MAQTCFNFIDANDASYIVSQSSMLTLIIFKNFYSIIISFYCSCSRPFIDAILFGQMCLFFYFLEDGRMVFESFQYVFIANLTKRVYFHIINVAFQSPPSSVQISSTFLPTLGYSLNISIVRLIWSPFSILPQIFQLLL